MIYNIIDYIWCQVFFNCKKKKLRQKKFPETGGDVLSPDPSSAEWVIIVSTYEEMQIILTIALRIVAILNLKNKK